MLVLGLVLVLELGLGFGNVLVPGLVLGLGFRNVLVPGLVRGLGFGNVLMPGLVLKLVLAPGLDLENSDPYILGANSPEASQAVLRGIRVSSCTQGYWSLQLYSRYWCLQLYSQYWNQNAVHFFCLFLTRVVYCYKCIL